MYSSLSVHPDGSLIAVVVPCYRVYGQILDVLGAMPEEVGLILCVDDACPDGTADLIESHCDDPRVHVIRHAVNGGVGAAVMTGYADAIRRGAQVIVKIDGDGQMDPSLLPRFVHPILNREADYTKGNRFFDLREIARMPVARRLGNVGLSFMAKASTGYWDVFDPTNGYTAIHANVAAMLPFESISKRYFFETDMLFRLNTLRATVVDIPMDALYGDEKSSLNIIRVVPEFLLKHVRNTFKRVLYNYFLRDVSIASLELVFGIALLVFGIVFGGYHWESSRQAGVNTPTGTIMLSVLPIILGLQLILSFLTFDVAAIPKNALWTRTGRKVTRGTLSQPDGSGGRSP